MGLSRAVVRHAKLVIALWVVALAAASPLAARLDEVLRYGEEAFLPEGAESTRAGALLKEKFAEAGAPERASVLVVTGIDAASDEARRAYEELKASVLGAVAANLTSYYDVLARLNATSYELALGIVRGLVNGTASLRDLTEEMLERYAALLDAALAVRNATLRARSLVLNVSASYGEAVRAVAELGDLLGRVRATVAELDRSFAELGRALEAMRGLVRSVNESLAGLSSALFGVESSFKLLYFDVTRAYYYLARATDAYATGRLDRYDVETVLRYTGESSVGPVSPALVAAVFNATYAVVGPRAELVDDLLLARVAAEILRSAGAPGRAGDLAWLAEAYYREFRGRLAAAEPEGARLVLGTYSLEPGLVGPSQDAALQLVAGLAGEALNATASRLAPTLYGLAERAGYPATARVVGAMLSEALSLGPSPSPEGLMRAVVRVAAVAVEEAGYELPVEPERVLEALYLRGPAGELLRWLFAEAVRARIEGLAPEAAAVVSASARAVAEADPDATGALLKDEGLLRSVTLSVVAELASARPELGGVPGWVLEELYDAGPDEGVLDAVARKLLKERVAALAGLAEAAGPDLEALAEVLVDAAASVRPSDEASVVEATKRVALAMLSGAGRPPAELAELVELICALGPEADAGTVRRRVVDPLFARAAGEIRSRLEEAGAGVAGLVEEVASWVASEYPASEDAVRRFVVGLVSARAGAAAAGAPVGAAELAALADRAYGIPPDDEAGVSELASDLGRSIMSRLLARVRPYLDTLKSPDNTTILVMFEPLGSTARERYGNALRLREEAVRAFSERFAGAEAYVAGGAVTDEELREAGREDVARARYLSYALTLAVLLALVRALLAALTPFVSVGAAIVVASGVAYVIAREVVDLSSWARVLMVTTALGLGVDYTTFYLHRFRELLGRGLAPEEAAAEALSRAKDGIAASALTDIACFAALTIAWDFPFLRTIGVAVPVAVASVFAASLTLVPALAALAGGSRRFWWPGKPGPGRRAPGRSAVVDAVVRARYAVLAAFIALSAPATYAFLTFEGSHDTSLYLPEGSQTERAYSLIEEKVGAAVTSPLYVVLSLAGPLDEGSLRLVEELSSAIAGVEHVKVVYGPTRPYGEPLGNLTLEGVAAGGGLAYVSTDNTTVLLKVTLDVPGGSDEALDAVRELRALLSEYRGRYGALREALVGGTPALFADLDDLLERSFWRRILPVSVALTLLTLALILRGVPAALLTLAVIYAGAAWSLWASTALFEELFGRPMLWFLPLVVLVVLMGVGVDYNSFYLVRVRDEMETRGPREALSAAAGASGRLIVGLAVILMSAYSSLLGTRMWAMRQMGFALALGLLVVALSAVYLVAPALLSLLGSRTWWPFGRRPEKGVGRRAGV